MSWRGTVRGGIRELRAIRRHRIRPDGRTRLNRQTTENASSVKLKNALYTTHRAHLVYYIFYTFLRQRGRLSECVAERRREMHIAGGYRMWIDSLHNLTTCMTELHYR